MTETHDDELDTLGEEQPDDTDLVRDLRSQIRARNKTLREQRRELEQANVDRGKLAKFERRDLLKEAGLDGLSERREAALFREVGDNPNADALREAAKDLFDIEAEASEEEQDVEALRRGRQATRGQAPRGGITAADFKSWDPEKRLRFRKQHPQEFEALKRGETVTGVPSF